MSFAPTPSVKKVACVKMCASHGRARQTGTVRISGSGLSGVVKVTFLGVSGKADDVSVNVRPKSDRRLTLKVPMNAMSGRLALITGGSVITTARTKPLGILPAPPPPPTTGQLTPVPGPRDPGGPTLETATSSNVAFAGSSRGITFSYRLSAPGAVEVDLIHVDDGSVVQTWQVPSVQPDVVNNITWEGMTNGAVQPDGRYAWRLTATGSTGAKARSAQISDPTRDVFDLHGHVFPLRGRHKFGDGFGVGRQGHTHQGQDILARCGLPILAAQAGTVLYNKRQSAAGNYLVVHGEDGFDYAYMHMRARSPFRPGDEVTTGETIGNVGETGDATTCHLHFEVWTPPGWYKGGHPFDTRPLLDQWDSYS